MTNTMKYKITVLDLFDNKKYTGIFYQEPDLPGVEMQALEFYADELGTDYENLEIISTVLIN